MGKKYLIEPGALLCLPRMQLWTQIQPELIVFTETERFFLKQKELVFVFRFKLRRKIGEKKFASGGKF